MHRVRRELFLPDDVPFGAGVRVAILDTGIDPNHPDLAGRLDLAASRNFSRIDDLLDRDGHGTHVAGIIAGTGAASNGAYRGIAPHATIVVCKILSRTHGQEMDAVAGIETALAAGADVINYSHGFAPPMDHPPPWLWSEATNVLEDAFIEAERRGVLCVVAAGNKGPTLASISRPGGLECVLTVGALGLNGEVYETSGRGPYLRSPSVRPGGWVRFDQPLHTDAVKFKKPDIVLPGAGITSLRSGHAPIDEDGVTDPRYIQMGGTSEATAVATGLAAAMLGLARAHGVDLGTNPGCIIRRLMICGASQLRVGGVDDFGSGTIVWQNLQSILSDFANDAQFRQRIVDGHELRLLD